LRDREPNLLGCQDSVVRFNLCQLLANRLPIFGTRVELPYFAHRTYSFSYGWCSRRGSLFLSTNGSFFVIAEAQSHFLLLSSGLKGPKSVLRLCRRIVA